eukprot:5155037-Prymnesium_polylepis.1
MVASSETGSSPSRVAAALDPVDNVAVAHRAASRDRGAQVRAREEGVRLYGGQWSYLHLLTDQPLVRLPADGAAARSTCGGGAPRAPRVVRQAEQPQRQRHHRRLLPVEDEQRCELHVVGARVLVHGVEGLGHDRDEHVEAEEHDEHEEKQHQQHTRGGVLRPVQAIELVVRTERNLEEREPPAHQAVVEAVDHGSLVGVERRECGGETEKRPREQLEEGEDIVAHPHDHQQQRALARTALQQPASGHRPQESEPERKQHLRDA